VDDPRTPSGGNTYDRRVRDGLVDAGWDVTVSVVPWDRPPPAAAFDALVTGESTFDQLPGVLSRLARGELRAACHRVRYGAHEPHPWRARRRELATWTA